MSRGSCSVCEPFAVHVCTYRYKHSCQFSCGVYKCVCFCMHVCTSVCMCMYMGHVSIYLCCSYACLWLCLSSLLDPPVNLIKYVCNRLLNYACLSIPHDVSLVSRLEQSLTCCAVYQFEPVLYLSCCSVCMKPPWEQVC